MRMALVLGAGGVVGASWLIGALDALEAELGVRPADADVVIGTSAGSVIGSLVAAGLPSAYLSAYASGATGPVLGEAERELSAQLEQARDEAPDRYRLQRSLPPIGPGSWRMAIATLRNPLRHPPAAVLGGWLPRGVLSTAPIHGLVERFVGERWPSTLRVVACDYRSGRRAVFGGAAGLAGRPADAVAASCAIPGFYHPVAIDGRRYIDGGVCSMSNLDLVGREGVDVAICLNPMSSPARVRSRHPAAPLSAAVRGAAGRRLAGEVRKLRDAGIEVLVIEPDADDLAVMGHNMMSRARRREVTGQARRGVAERLRSDGAPPWLGRRATARAPLRRAA